MNPPDPPSAVELAAAAAAIANARGARRGVPPIENILDVLPPKLLKEVMDDAREALDAAALARAGQKVSPPAKVR